MKKYFLFSDVHGEFSALLASLDKAGFEPENENHILIGVGDYFDRGNENKQILNFLIEYKEKERFQGIYGNHDQMLDHFLRGSSDGIYDFLYNGLDKTLNDLSGLDCRQYIHKFPQLIIDKVIENNRGLINFLDSLEDKIEIDNYEIIHGGYSKHLLTKSNSWIIDNWTNTEKFIESFNESDLYNPDKIYIFGHWHARKLNNKFNKQKNNLEHGFVVDDKTFEYENFIGLDACTNLSGFVNIYIIEV
jgi:serine/threonine protein phosphatase 1